MHLPNCNSMLAANAGFFSGSTGLESVPGPELPKIEFLDRWNGMQAYYFVHYYVESRQCLEKL